MGDNREILTVGHSTHPVERFVALLQRAGVESIADVRRFPGSRRNPQFGAEALAGSLGAVRIGYEPFGEELGGRRRSSRPRQSPWRNPSFAAYAEYADTPAFAAGLERLEALAIEKRTATMCAEGDWRRCHRRLIADALVPRGWRVLHLRPDGSLETHPQTILG
jgi:uncharacterized protein (DUF488 family)